MSFWDTSPGPFWSDVFKGWFSCTPPPRRPLCLSFEEKPRPLQLSSTLRFQRLDASHSEAIRALLYADYQTFPRSRISLSKERIHDGFQKDGWIGCGVFEETTLVGCCISRKLGILRIHLDEFTNCGLVDFFCVKASHRKQGIASFLLQELVHLTAKSGRLLHIFQKEGIPLSPVPPIWQSSYLWRQKETLSGGKEYLRPQGIAPHHIVPYFEHTSHIPYHNTIINIPQYLTGDSELFAFHYKGMVVFMCLTDTFHRSVPEGWRIGELSWIVPVGTVPQEIQEAAVETLVDSCSYEIVLLDQTIPHRKTKPWRKDSPYGYYLFNYNPGTFFKIKPYFIL
jgi:GNAT superfamily N-acetyltransferase